MAKACCPSLPSPFWALQSDLRLSPWSESLILVLNLLSPLPSLCRPISFQPCFSQALGQVQRYLWPSPNPDLLNYLDFGLGIGQPVCSLRSSSLVPFALWALRAALSSLWLVRHRQDCFQLEWWTPVGCSKTHHHYLKSSAISSNRHGRQRLRLSPLSGLDSSSSRSDSGPAVGCFRWASPYSPCHSPGFRSYSWWMTSPWSWRRLGSRATWPGLASRRAHAKGGTRISECRWCLHRSLLAARRAQFRPSCPSFCLQSRQYIKQIQLYPCAWKEWAGRAPQAPD